MVRPRVLIGIIAGLLFSSIVLAENQAKEQEAELFIVHFELGPAWDKQLKPHQQTQFAAHAENLQRLRSLGHIKFGARYEELGVIVLSAANMHAAQQEIENDPGVLAEIFRFRIAPLNVFFPWQ